MHVASISFYLPAATAHHAVGTIKNFSISCAELVMKTAKKIADYIKQYKKIFILFSLLALALKICQVTNPIIAVTTLPSLAWHLCFTKGDFLPTQYVEEWTSERQHDCWTPVEPDDETSPDLKKRAIQFKKVIKRLKLKPTSANPHLGWTLLHGESRVGKSSSLESLATRLSEKGHRVFQLNTKKLKDEGGKMWNTVGGDCLKIFLYLYWIAASSEKPPILIIDEAHELINPNARLDIRFNDTLGCCYKFNVLASTTTDEISKKAFWSKFVNNKFLLTPLTEGGISKTLHKGHFKSLDETVVAHAVKLAPEQEAHVWMDSASKLLGRAGQRGVITTEMLDRLVMS